MFHDCQCYLRDAAVSNYLDTRGNFSPLNLAIQAHKTNLLSVTLTVLMDLSSSNYA